MKQQFWKYYLITFFLTSKKKRTKKRKPGWLFVINKVFLGRKANPLWHELFLHMVRISWWKNSFENTIWLHFFTHQRKYECKIENLLNCWLLGRNANPLWHELFFTYGENILMKQCFWKFYLITFFTHQRNTNVNIEDPVNLWYESSLLMLKRLSYVLLQIYLNWLMITTHMYDLLLWNGFDENLLKHTDSKNDSKWRCLYWSVIILSNFHERF